jgi:predicted MPP superfamily phosphohydrolase
MTWIRRLSLLVLAVVALGVAALIAGVWIARSTPVVRRISMGLEGWPAGAPPLRVALLSDIHIGGAAMDAGRLTRIVAQVNAQRPDLVLIAGDFVNGHDPQAAPRYAAELVAPLSRLSAPLGTAAVLGNHDQGTTPQAIEAALARAHVEVLENRAVRRGPLTLVGVGDAYSGHDRLAQALASAAGMAGARIVLTHSPDLAWRLPAGWPLLLAGHTHCGQVYIPFVSNLFLRRQNGRLFDPRYRCGLVRDPGRLTVVTAGLGASGPQVRLGAPPDWWLITLGPRRAGATSPG